MRIFIIGMLLITNQLYCVQTRHQASVADESAESIDNCAICLQPNDSEPVTLPSNHRFHLACIAQHIRTSGIRKGEKINFRCPICREECHDPLVQPDELHEASHSPNFFRRMLSENVISRLLHQLDRTPREHQIHEDNDDDDYDMYVARSRASDSELCSVAAKGLVITASCYIVYAGINFACQLF